MLRVPFPVMPSSVQTLSAWSLVMYHGRFFVDGFVGRLGLVIVCGVVFFVVLFGVGGGVLAANILEIPFILVSSLSPFGVVVVVKPLMIQWRLSEVRCPFFCSFVRSLSAFL